MTQALEDAMTEARAIDARARDGELPTDDILRAMELVEQFSEACQVEPELARTIVKRLGGSDDG
jgi:hypothetical protein